MAKVNMKEQLVKDYSAKIAEINTAISSGTNAEVEARLAELVNIEKQYFTIHEKDVFDSFQDIHTALLNHEFDTISHKVERENGIMTSVVAITKRVMVDLRKYCEFRRLPMGWYYEMQALNKRLTLKVAEELKVSAEAMRHIDNSYAMDKLADEIKLGKTPTSRTQCIAHMQKVLDELSPNEGRVINRDFNFLWMTYAKVSSKDSLKVVCSRHNTLQKLLTAAFHRIVAEKSYGIEFQECKERVSSAAVTDTPKAETKAKGLKSKSDSKAEGVKPEAENKAE